MSDEVVDVFLGTMDDLAYSSRLRADEYEAARAAALVRRILVDQICLLHQIRKVTDARFSAEVSETSYALDMPDGPHVLVSGAVLDPVVFDMTEKQLAAMLAAVGESRQSLGLDGRRTTHLNEQRFLRHEVAHEVGDGGRVATVKDIVRLYANHLGGVHFENESHVNELLLEVRARHTEMLRETMLAIGRVVHRALEPTALFLTLRGSDYDANE